MAQYTDSVEILTTNDGSHTLRNLISSETYHSTHGAITESYHVYIKNGLKYFIDQNPTKNYLSILEFGLGTGLNFLLTTDFIQSNFSHLTVDYWAVEPFFVRKSILQSLNYGKFIQEASVFESYIKAWDSDPEQELLFQSKQVCLKAINQPLHAYQTDRTFDIIYFDAFSASNQPELWDFEALERVVSYMHSGSVWVTYAIRGPIKQALRSLGCTVERLKGPPGKAQMLRAIKN